MKTQVCIGNPDICFQKTGVYFRKTDACSFLFYLIPNFCLIAAGIASLCTMRKIVLART